MSLGMKNLSLIASGMVVYLILSGYAEAQNEQEKAKTSIFCRFSEDQEFCDILVKGANTSTEATTRAIRESILIVRILEPYVHKSMNALEIAPEPRKIVMDICKSDYKKVTNYYSNALNHLSKGNKRGMIAHLTKKIMTNCVDSLNKYNVHAPVLRKAKSDMDKYMNTCALLAKNV